MPTPYEVNNTVRFANRVIAQLLHWGMPLPNYSILTVQGRKSGKSYSLPVVLIDPAAKTPVFVSPLVAVSPPPMPVMVNVPSAVDTTPPLSTPTP